jgi:hypothetical protein
MGERRRILTWHNGIGGGLWLAPAGVVFTVCYAHSKDGGCRLFHWVSVLKSFAFLCENFAYSFAVNFLPQGNTQIS